MKNLFTIFNNLINGLKRSNGLFETLLFGIFALLVIAFVFSIAPILTIAAVNVFLKVFGVTTIPITVSTVLATFWLLLVASSSSNTSNKEEKEK